MDPILGKPALSYVLKRVPPHGAWLQSPMAPRGLSVHEPTRAALVKWTEAPQHEDSPAGGGSATSYFHSVLPYGRPLATVLGVSRGTATAAVAVARAAQGVSPVLGATLLHVLRVPPAESSSSSGVTPAPSRSWPCVVIVATPVVELNCTLLLSCRATWHPCERVRLLRVPCRTRSPCCKRHLSKRMLCCVLWCCPRCRTLALP